MTTAIIIAGGSGTRMGQDIPKQFINVYDKPVLIYTLEGFQKHPQIDAIEVVCINFLKGDLTEESLLQKTNHSNERQRVEDAVCHELLFFFKVDAADISRQHLHDLFSDRHIYFGTDSNILDIDIFRS